MAFYLGLALLALGGYGLVRVAGKLYRASRLEVAGRATSGRVVSVEVHEIGANDATTAVIVAFRTAEGEERRFPSGLSDRRGRRVGDAVDVLYDPAAPGTAEIDSLETLWMPAIIVLVVTVVLLIVPGAGLVWLTRFRASTEDAATGPRPSWVPGWWVP